MDILVHVSNKLVDELRPGIKSLPYICFSLNIFISQFGEYLYLFDKKELEKYYHVECCSSGNMELSMHLKHEMIYHFRSRELEDEYRIYKPIDVKKYCLGIIKQFNHCEGILEKRFMDKIIYKEKIYLGG